MIIHSKVSKGRRCCRPAVCGARLLRGGVSWPTAASVWSGRSPSHVLLDVVGVRGTVVSDRAGIRSCKIGERNDDGWRGPTEFNELIESICKLVRWCARSAVDRRTQSDDLEGCGRSEPTVCEGVVDGVADNTPPLAPPCRTMSSSRRPNRPKRRRRRRRRAGNN